MLGFQRPVGRPIITLALAFLAAACAPAPAAQPTAAPKPTAAAPAAPASAPTTAPAAKPTAAAQPATAAQPASAAKTLTIGMSEEPRGFGVQIAQITAIEVEQSMNAYFTYRDADLNPQPWLVEKIPSVKD